MESSEAVQPISATSIASNETKYPKYDNTNLFELVNLVCDLTARDLKNLLVVKGAMQCGAASFFTASFPAKISSFPPAGV